MDKDSFRFLANAERNHWWFRGRREFIRKAITRVSPPSGAMLLDAGCGSGGNLALLAEFGKVHGFEYDDDARCVAAGLGLGPVEAGSLPHHVPFDGTTFDVIGLFDVLEHVEHPVESLIALRDRIAAGGALVLTVPANPWLWGPYDVACHHFRRYTRGTLVEHLSAAGMRVEYVSYFNALLLPLAIAQRVKERVIGYSSEELTTGSALNEVLFNTWMLEKRWIPRRELPFGLSLIAVARHG